MLHCPKKSYSKSSLNIDSAVDGDPILITVVWEEFEGSGEDIEKI